MSSTRDTVGRVDAMAIPLIILDKLAKSIFAVLKNANKLFSVNAHLYHDTVKCSDLQFAMHRHNTAM